MPFVNVKTAKGLLDEQQKSDLSARLTDLMVEIEGRGNRNFRDLVWVLIEEHDAASWCLGGTQGSEEKIRQLAEG
jgi:4-oxalocrotonate tautomerase